MLRRKRTQGLEAPPGSEPQGGPEAAALCGCTSSRPILIPRPQRVSASADAPTANAARAPPSRPHTRRLPAHDGSPPALSARARAPARHQMHQARVAAVGHPPSTPDPWVGRTMKAPDWKAPTQGGAPAMRSRSAPRRARKPPRAGRRRRGGPRRRRRPRARATARPPPPPGAAATAPTPRDSRGPRRGRSPGGRLRRRALQRARNARRNVLGAPPGRGREPRAYGTLQDGRRVPRCPLEPADPLRHPHVDKTDDIHSSAYPWRQAATSRPFAVRLGRLRSLLASAAARNTNRVG